ncbi:ABC transporter permease [Brachybacterium endophyticum]|uniref:ABC transporter permease n=1 Tax=Brachybacterium endophyticum TaxID=2182385 RepID=A0A2U2RKI6_9MICO|nr:ABC transporter permease [Brachybacterium endophyticum]PWH06370.1 ABC transporter permease [Brachybacterium endophyticum]
MTVATRASAPAGARRAPRTGRGLPAIGAADAAAVLFLVLLLIALIAPSLLARADPLAAADGQGLLAPSTAHWFGTDYLGRDVYTRVVHGARASLSASAVAVAVGLAGGLTLGVVSGYLGGVVDSVISRLIDVLLSVPGLLLSMVIVVSLGFGAVNAAIAVGISSIASFARVTRSGVLTLRSSGYVEAAQHQGASRLRTLAHHILPNAVGPVVSLIPLQFGGAIVWISSLSFLGFGAVPPSPEWGLQVSEGRQYLLSAPWLLLAPGVVIVLTVLSASHLQGLWEKIRRTSN